MYVCKQWDISQLLTTKTSQKKIIVILDTPFLALVTVANTPDGVFSKFYMALFAKC